MSRPHTIQRLTRRQWLRTLAAAPLGGAVGGCAWIDSRQRQLIYRPTSGRLDDWQPISAHDEPLWIDLPPTADGQPQRLRALWIPQADNADAPAALYLHGTFRNLFQNQPKIAAIHASGFAVLAIDYRGWGESSALLPSEASIDADCDAAWAALQTRAPVAGRRIIYGHSLGSGAAVGLAWRQRGDGSGRPPYGALVLESAFTSLPDIARERGIAGSMLATLATQQFDSLSRIGAIDAPKWFVAGSADSTVPPVHSERLFAAASEPRRLVLIEGGGHSRLYSDAPAAYASIWAEVMRTTYSAR